MTRSLSQKGLSSSRTLTGLSNTLENQEDIGDIKTRIDYDTIVSNGNLLIGNNAGNFTSSTLTAGSNISITNSSGGITIESTDTNFFQTSGSNISALNTTDNLLLGTTTNTNNRKLLVNGNLESSLSFSGAFISTSGLFDANFHTMISNSIASILQIGSANNTRILRFYNDGVFHRFSTNASSGDVIVLEDTTQTLTNKTLTDPVINKIKNSNDRVISEYNSGISRLFLGNTTDNIQMFNAFLVSPKIEDASTNNYYNIVASELTSNIDITLPVLSSNDEFVFKDATQTLTSKTLDSPTINTAVSGTAILDEDDLASNSATKLATQQSIKSYVDTLKTKYDFTATVSNGKLLIGNSFGNYSVNNLTAGTGISIINTIGNIIVACTVTDTNFFQKSSSNISALNTSDNLLLGTTSNSNSRKLLVNGTAEITGKLTLGSTLNDLTIPALTDTIAVLNGTQTFLSKTLDSPTINTAVSGTAILDEDDLASNSATKLATQQSIKSYVDTLKTKYDFTTSVSNGKLLIGNSSGNYTVNNLTAGTGISITNTSGNISVASTITDTNFFNKTSSNIFPINTSDNLLVGTSSNTAPYKLSVVGTANISGKLTLESTINDLTLPTGTDTFCLLNASQTLDSKTLTNSNLVLPTISRVAGGGFSMLNVFNSIITLGNSTDTSEILNGIATDMILTTPKIQDTSSNHTYNITVSELAADREINLPTLNSNDTFVFASVIQTLQNKTLSGGSISAATISGSTINNDINGNATTATSINGITTSNIVQLTSTQTLTNKTISGTLLTGAPSSFIFRIHDLSLNNTYIIRTEELSSNHSLTIPAITNDTGKFVIDNLAQTLTNKTLINPQIMDANSSHSYDFLVSDLTSNRNILLPLLTTDDTFVFASHEEVLENKTIKHPDLLANPITFSPVSTGNNFDPVLFMDGNRPLGSTIAGGALNNGGQFRSFCWGVESTTNSYRALGLFANNTDSYTFTDGANFTFMGFFTPFSKNTAYSFTASHRCYSENNDLYNDDKIGLIVVSTGKYDSLYIDNIVVDNAVPIVELCNKKKCKSVLGVIGKYEKKNEDREGMNFGYVQISDKDKERLYINSIGEGGIWVCNTNGNFENGDYIQSSNIAGYGELQDDDFLHNYSVAKITCDCDFDNIQEGFEKRILENNVIAVFVGAIYQQG